MHVLYTFTNENHPMSIASATLLYICCDFYTVCHTHVRFIFYNGPFLDYSNNVFGDFFFHYGICINSIFKCHF